MAITKPTNRSVNLKRAELSRLRLKLARVRAIAVAKEQAFWPHLKAELDELVRGHGARIEAILDTNDYDPSIAYAQARDHRGSARAAQYIKSLFEQPQDMETEILNRIATYEDQIKSAEESGALEE